MPLDPHRGPDGRPVVGRVLGGTYEVERPLGSGGMGAVFVARHVRTGRRYAVKVLLQDRALSPENSRRFRREAKALSALGHAGIIAVHDYAEGPDGLAYIAMDLLEGEDLASRLRRAPPLAWPEIQRICEEVAAALGAAHAVGIMHRDLKPANIFLARQPGAPDRAVLLDFGLAKATDPAAQTQLTSTGEVLGTPLYMAPEQARGDDLDGRADLYSLAAVLYEMVTGTPPFSGPNVTAVLARLLTEAPPPAAPRARTPVPAAIDAVLQRALAKRPADRFPNAAELAGAVARAGLGPLQPVHDPALALTAATLIPPPAPPGRAPDVAFSPPAVPAAGPLAAPAPPAAVPATAVVAPAVAAVPIVTTAPPFAAVGAPRRPGRAAVVGLALALPVVSALVVGVWWLRSSPAGTRAAAPPVPGLALYAVDGGPTPYLDLRVAMAHAARDWRQCLNAVSAATAGLGTLQTQVNCAFQEQDVEGLRRLCDELQRRFPDDVATPTCRQAAAQLDRLLAATPAPGPGAARPITPLPAPPAPPSPAPTKTATSPKLAALPRLPVLPTAPLPPTTPQLPTVAGVPALPPHLAAAAEHQKHGRFRECVAAARQGPPTEQGLNWQFGCAAFVGLAEVKRVCADTARHLPATHAFVKRCQTYVTNLEAARPPQVP
jgi:serine/threonine-protein kinase